MIWVVEDGVTTLSAMRRGVESRVLEFETYSAR
jgi:hypothetical protein